MKTSCGMLGRRDVHEILNVSLLLFEDDGKQEAIRRITCGHQDARASGIPPSLLFLTDGNGPLIVTPINFQSLLCLCALLTTN